MSRRWKKSRRRTSRRSARKANKKRKFLNINSQIFNGISFVILGVLMLRFSSTIFINMLSWAEGVFWGYLIGVVLILGGILSLVAWWKNNVSMFTSKHNVKWN